MSESLRDYRATCDGCGEARPIVIIEAHQEGVGSSPGHYCASCRTSEMVPEFRVEMGSLGVIQQEKRLGREGPDGRDPGSPEFP